jgi:hypothetical protein
MTGEVAEKFLELNGDMLRTMGYYP